MTFANQSLKLIMLLSLSVVQTGCQGTNNQKPDYLSMEKAGEACDRDLDKYLNTEIRKTNNSEDGNWTYIKNDAGEYAIIDSGCKPIFGKGDTTGFLMPYFFYLKGGTINRVQLNDLKSGDVPEDTTRISYYSYPLGQKVQIESSMYDHPRNVLEFPYSSIKAEGFAWGVAFGAVLQTYRAVYKYRTISIKEGERAVRSSREWIIDNIMQGPKKQNPFGPQPKSGEESMLKILDGRWEKCKAEGYAGWN